MLFDKFTDTIFLKESSTLQNKYDALVKLSKDYPDNDKIKEELYIVKQGLYGERAVKYQLNKSNIGMYVLNDINISYGDMKAQIDYVIITKAYIYFVECKNLIGNITVTDTGDFIREYTFNNKKVRKGIYSPLRQVEAQRDVYKKIWNNRLSKNKIVNDIKRIFAEKRFTYYHRVLVVAANHETILNLKEAPSDIKNKIIKADMLVRLLQKDIENSDKDAWDSRKGMEDSAKFFLSINEEDNTNYVRYYRDKYISDDKASRGVIRYLLLEFRKKRAKEMGIPPYYVYNNDELDKIIDMLPKTSSELSNILPDIKVKTHGEYILDIINKECYK